MSNVIPWHNLPNPCVGLLRQLREQHVAICPISDHHAVLCAKHLEKAPARKYFEYYLKPSARSLAIENEWMIDEESIDQQARYQEIWPTLTFTQLILQNHPKGLVADLMPSEVLFQLIKWAQVENALPQGVVLHENLESKWVAPLHSDHHDVEAIRSHYIFSSVIANQNILQKSMLSVVASNLKIHRQTIQIGDMYLLDPVVPHSLHPHLEGEIYGGFEPDTDPLGSQAYHQVFIPRQWVQTPEIATILEVLISRAFCLSGCQATT